MRTNRLLTVALAAGLSAGLLTGCGQQQQGISLYVTDAPVDALEEVVVSFDQVVFHNEDGAEVVVNASTSADLPASIDLTDYTGGATAVLLNTYPLPAGNYDWFRVSIEPYPATYVTETVGGAQLPLQCPSCDQSGLKFNRSFTVEETGLVEFTLDFNLRSSITENASGYLLRPTVRILDAATVMSEIAGTVTDDTTSQQFLTPLDAEECVVYGFEGAGVTPDDIYIDDQDVDRGPEVVVTDVVEFDGNDFVYLLSMLPAGLDYTVALTCAEDDPAAEDDIPFYGAATVSLGTTPATHHFVLTDADLAP